MRVLNWNLSTPFGGKEEISSYLGNILIKLCLSLKSLSLSKSFKSKVVKQSLSPYQESTAAFQSSLASASRLNDWKMFCPTWRFKVKESLRVASQCFFLPIVLNIQSLDPKSVDSPAVRAIVAELALIRQSLQHRYQESNVTS